MFVFVSCSVMDITMPLVKQSISCTIAVVMLIAFLDMLSFFVNIKKHPTTIVSMWLNLVPDSHKVALLKFVAFVSTSTYFV